MSAGSCCWGTVLTARKHLVAAACSYVAAYEQLLLLLLPPAAPVFAAGSSLMIYPRVLYRDNLVDANPNEPSSIGGGVLYPGISARNREEDPFAVLGNREARSAEIFVTYDPTGATPFYHWDNDMRENAAFAFNVGANYTEYPSFTDSELFFFDDGVVSFNAPFGVGLPEEEVWKVSNRMVFNTGRNMKIISNLLAGWQQSTGDPDGGTRKFYEADGKFIYDKKHIFSGYFKKDAWGPYDFHRQFNITYPEQYKLEYALLLDEHRDEDASSKIGVRALYRTLAIRLTKQLQKKKKSTLLATAGGKPRTRVGRSTEASPSTPAAPWSLRPKEKTAPSEVG